MTRAIRVMLADDHALVRAGIRSLLQGLGGVEVVGEAGDGREALHLLETQRPDVLLMDLMMPGLGGLEALPRVRNEFPQVRVLVLSMHANEEYVLRALRDGAAGYLLKGATRPELEMAVRAVARGETYLSPAMSKSVVEGYLRGSAAEGSAGVQLTPRQREVLQLIAEGGTNKEIGQRLGVSVKTVETHRMQLMERLGVHDVAGLVRYAVRIGLVSAEG